jgi:hypothetical protein
LRDGYLEVFGFLILAVARNVSFVFYGEPAFVALQRSIPVAVSLLRLIMLRPRIYHISRCILDGKQ